MKIFVGNLSFQVTAEDIHAAFGEYGEVTNIELITDRHTGQSKGFGFFEMRNNSEADRALKALNGTQFMGRTLKANQAQAKKPERGRHRSRY